MERKLTTILAADVAGYAAHMERDASAIAFAERQGWHYVARDPPARRIYPKGYADNLRHDPAEAILRSQQAQDADATISAEPAWQITAARHPSDAKQAS